jgi:hypothetical protein
MQKRLFAALLVLVGLVLASPAQTTKLEWKFTEGDKGKFYQTVTTKTKQEMTITGQKITQSQSQTFIFSWTPKKYDKEKKTWTVVQKIEGVKMEIEIGGNKISYDSTKDSGQNNPLGEFFKQLVDSEFTITLGEDMKVQGKVEGKDAFVTKLTKANAQMEPLLKEILSDEALKQMADPTFGALPGKDVKLAKGATWDRDSELNMGPIGKYKTKYTYTFEGKKDDKDKLYRIKVVTKLTYSPPDPKAQPQLPFKILKADLKTKKASGTILFDPVKGRVASSDQVLELDGSLDIEIGGMTTKVELNQTQTTTVETSDKNPIKK